MVSQQTFQSKRESVDFDASSQELLGLDPQLLDDCHRGGTGNNWKVAHTHERSQATVVNFMNTVSHASQLALTNQDTELPPEAVPGGVGRHSGRQSAGDGSLPGAERNNAPGEHLTQQVSVLDSSTVQERSLCSKGEVTGVPSQRDFSS